MKRILFTVCFLLAPLSVFASPWDTGRISRLRDVDKSQTTATGDTLIYNSTSQLWEKSSSSNVAMSIGGDLTSSGTLTADSIVVNGATSQINSSTGEDLYLNNDENGNIIFLNAQHIMTTAGDIGFGEQSPDKKMHITIPDGDLMKWERTGASSGSWTIDITTAAGGSNGTLHWKPSANGDFTITNSGNASVFFADTSALKVGFGTATPNARIEIDTATDEALEALRINQDDANEPFLKYEGTSAADQTNNISTVNGDGSVEGPKNYSSTAGWQYEGMVRIDVNGTDYWTPYYSADVD